MLSKKLLTHKAKGFVKKNQAPRSSMNYNQVNDIGILFSINSVQKHEQIKHLIKTLENDGKKVEVLAFLPKNQENHEFLFDFFTAKEITFWGNIESDKVKSFINKSFDYLFYIDEESNLILRNILAQSKAKCRVAKYDEENALYSEMMVQVPKDGGIKKLIEEMYRYTKLLS
ncbi:MAG: hypothetical protein RLO81_04850 [Fulvivirga sp.]|uniref:DUF6913 domain-containing protein n=1 Tax=Fulvivirga sp. TaxID=1931237 RepID=UPI0032EDD9BA